VVVAATNLSTVATSLFIATSHLLAIAGAIAIAVAVRNLVAKIFAVFSRLALS
jgi:hypothetical protein